LKKNDAAMVRRYSIMPPGAVGSKGRSSGRISSAALSVSCDSGLPICVCVFQNVSPMCMCIRTSHLTSPCQSARGRVEQGKTVEGEGAGEGTGREGEGVCVHACVGGRGLKTALESTKRQRGYKTAESKYHLPSQNIRGCTRKVVYECIWHMYI